MNRSFTQLLMKCDNCFTVFENKCVSRVYKLSVSQNFNYYNRHINDINNCQFHSFKLPIFPSRPSAFFVTNQKRFSQKVDVEEISKHVPNETVVKDDDSNEVTNMLGSPNLQSESENIDLFDNINFDEITGGDSETLNKLKLMMLEVDVLRQDGFRVPKRLTTDNWKELLTLKSRNQKRKLLEFLWVVEIRKSNDKKKREIRKKELEEQRAELNNERENSDHITYGFQGNTIFIRVYDSTINNFDNGRLMQAMLHGLDLVVDCGYHSNMSHVENKLCAKQLCYLFAENRLDKDPFNIHFCNVNKNSICFKQLKKFVPTLEDPGFPMNISEDHYTKLFPKEKLVYLTPHCRTELQEFNPDDVYIIGALVDKQNNEPLSMAKAKSEGIRMARLPLDRYLDWELGTKSLTVNQMVKILLDMHASGDWNLALRHVPRRKLRVPGEPKEDLRRYKRNRGTVFQPPANYSKSRKNW